MRPSSEKASSTPNSPSIANSTQPLSQDATGPAPAPICEQLARRGGAVPAEGARPPPAPSSQVPPPQPMNVSVSPGIPLSESRFKTKLCLNYAKFQECPYGMKCQFAHGDAELRSSKINEDLRVVYGRTPQNIMQVAGSLGTTEGSSPTTRDDAPTTTPPPLAVMINLGAVSPLPTEVHDASASPPPATTSSPGTAPANPSVQGFQGGSTPFVHDPYSRHAAYKPYSS